MADADGDQLDRRAVLDLLDDVAQVLLEIVAGIYRQRRIVDRRAVGDHHQDAPLLGAAEQALMRPIQRLAVDVLLQQALAHHQAQILARAPPWRVGALVDEMAQVVEAAGRRRLAGLKPSLARLPALPGPRREAEDFDLDAAALQRARQYVGTGGGDGDGAAAHRAGIVDQQGDHRVAEVHVLLALERQRLLRVDDDARQARGIEHALFQVELPGAALLRHQLALQAIGQAGNDAGEVLQLLVQIVAQALQFLRLAQVLGFDGLVEFVGESFVVGAAPLAPRRGRRRVLRRFVGVAGVGIVGEFTRRRVGGLHRALFEVLSRIVGGFHLHGLLRILLLALAFAGVGAVGRLVLARFVRVGVLVGARIGAHVERSEQSMDRLGEGALVEQDRVQRVERARRLGLDEGAPEIDDALRAGRRRQARQALAHQHRHGVLQRRLGAVLGLGEGALVVAVVEHGGQVRRHAFHAARADGLDARLLDGVEQRPRRLVRRRQPAMHGVIVAGEAQRHRIGEAAQDRRLARVGLARRLRQARLGAVRPGDQRGLVGREDDLQLGMPGHGARAGGDGALERLVGRLGLGAGPAVGGLGVDGGHFGGVLRVGDHHSFYRLGGVRRTSRPCVACKFQEMIWRRALNFRRQRRTSPLPTISAFYGILIQMFYADHAPPHFHAQYAEHEALINIATLELIEGGMPRRALALVLEWAQEHRSELMEDWDLCARLQTPRKIAPLP